MWEESIKCSLKVTQRQNGCAQRQFPLFFFKRQHAQRCSSGIYDYTGEEEGAQIKSRMDAPRRFTEVLETTWKASRFGKTELLRWDSGLERKVFEPGGAVSEHSPWYRCKQHRVAWGWQGVSLASADNHMVICSIKTRAGLKCWQYGKLMVMLQW